MQKFFLIELLIVCLALCFAVILFSRPCGSWRWNIKSCSDPLSKNINFIPDTITIDSIYKIARPFYSLKNQGRMPCECKCFSIPCYLYKYTTEADRDVHLVVKSLTKPYKYLICEIPADDCLTNCVVPDLRKKINDSKSVLYNLKVNSIGSWNYLNDSLKAYVTGVFFFDQIHNVGIFHSINYSELHPVFNISLCN